MKTPLVAVLDEAQGSDWDVLRLRGGKPRFFRLVSGAMGGGYDTPATEEACELIRRIVSGQERVTVKDPAGHETLLEPGFFLDCQLRIVDADNRAGEQLQTFFDSAAYGPVYRYPHLVSLQAPAAPEVAASPDKKPRYVVDKKEGPPRTAQRALLDHWELLTKLSLRAAAREIASWMEPPKKPNTVEGYIRNLWHTLPELRQKAQED